MAASALTNEGRMNGLVFVRLSHLPLTLRQDVAHDLARRWGLRGIEYAQLMLLASAPPKDRDPELGVPREKYEQVMAGKRPKGAFPKELNVAPVTV